MKNRLNIYYDEKDDLLELQIEDPTPAYYEEISEGIFERRDEKTKKVKGFAVFSFRKRIANMKNINVELPVNVELISK